MSFFSPFLAKISEKLGKIFFSPIYLGVLPGHFVCNPHHKMLIKMKDAMDRKDLLDKDCIRFFY